MPKTWIWLPMLYAAFTAIKTEVKEGERGKKQNAHITNNPSTI